MAKAKPAQEVKKVVDINQASHMAMPKEVFNALTQLVGAKIPWGEADQVMTLVKQTTAPVELVVTEDKTDDAGSVEG